MSETVSMPQEHLSLSFLRKPFAQLTTVALVIYPILLAWFTAPSRFLDDHGYEAKLHGTRISSEVVPLELPKDEVELAHALRTEDSRVHEAQVNLFRVAQAWDNVFIEIYVFQFVAMALLADVTGARFLVRLLAIAAVVIAGTFDRLENIRIDDILNRGYPPFGDLIAQVTAVSTIKWISLFIAFSLLAPVLWKLPDAGRKFRIALVAALVASSISGFIGVFVWPHRLLQLAMALYGIAPVLILWCIVLKPAIDAADTKLQAAAALVAVKEIQATEAQGQLPRFNVEFLSTAPKWSLDTLENPPEASMETKPPGDKNKK